MLLVTVEDLKINGRQYNRWAFLFVQFYSTNKKGKLFCVPPSKFKKKKKITSKEIKNSAKI